MSHDDDSRKLVDSPDESLEVRSLLVSGATDEIDYDYARGLSTHLSAIGLAAPAAPTASAAAAKGLALSGAKAWMAVAVGTVVLASAIAVFLSSAKVTPAPGAAPRDPRATTETAGAAPAPLPNPQGPSEPVRAAPSEPAPAPRASADAQRRSGSRATPESQAGPGTEHIVLAESAEAPEPGRGSARVATAPAGASAARAVSSSDADHAAAEAEEEARRSAAAEARKAESDRVAREMAQLVEAKRALSSDPAGALALAQAGEREFPHGVLVEERQHLLILALIGVGRLDEARRRAAPYIERHPDSPFARRVQQALDARAAR